MSTMQDLCDLARSSLNDSAKVRFSDTDCLKYANMALAATYKVRPDLKFGSYSTEFTPLVIGGTFPLPVQFEPAIADYVGFRCELRDDDATNVNKSAIYGQLFEKQVMML